MIAWIHYGNFIKGLWYFLLLNDNLEIFMFEIHFLLHMYIHASCFASL